MKTGKLILWSAIINLVALIIISTVFILVYNKTIPAIFLAIPIFVMLFMFLIYSAILTTSIKDRLFILKYDELVELIDKNTKEWEKAVKMSEILGQQEAIKLYNEKYPKSNQK